MLGLSQIKSLPVLPATRPRLRRTDGRSRFIPITPPGNQAIVQAIAQHTPNTGLTRFVRKSKKWLNGVVTDMKMSRGGCRHFVRCASGETEDSHGAGSADWFTLNRVEIRWSLEEGPEPDLSFLPSSAPMQSTRRGMGGMAAMFAKSLAAPAPLGTWRAANISSTDSKEKEDDDDEEDEEDERAIFLAVQKADAEAKALRDSDGGGENVRGGGGAAAMDADAEEDATVLPNAADTDPPPEHGLVGVLPDDLPDVVTVICKQTAGDYYPRTGLIKCLCDACQEGLGFGEDLDDEADETGVKKEKEHAAGEEESTHEKMDPNRWEMHCGMGQAKKWKASVRVVLANHRTMPVGKWLTGFGVAVSARLPRREVKYGPKVRMSHPTRSASLIAHTGLTLSFHLSAFQVEQAEKERTVRFRRRALPAVGADGQRRQGVRQERPASAIGETDVRGADSVRRARREVAVERYGTFPLNAHRLSDCPYTTDHFFFISRREQQRRVRARGVFG